MKNNNSGTGKRVALIILCVVLTVVLVAMLGATIFVERLLGKMNYVDTSEHAECRRGRAH